MKMLHRMHVKIQDFLQLSRQLDGEYMERITKNNGGTITAAAVLTMVVECIMIIRVFISHPTLSTTASRIYMIFYLSLLAVAGLFLYLQPGCRHNTTKAYRLQHIFVVSYLLWSALLNSYDLYRTDHGSSLALVTALIFASILIKLRPHHMMALQTTTFLIFFYLNQNRVEDQINATIAVVVAVTANLLFYARDIHTVHNQQQLAQMNDQLEKEQMDGAMQYLHRLREAQQQTAIHHHDLRHTLNLVEQLAKQGDLEKLQSFLSSSQETVKEVAPVFYCQHQAANLILGSFAQRAEEKNIRWETEIRLPEELPLADTELCALLCNLLENALQATTVVEQEKQRFISIKATEHEGKLVISVTNGFAGQVTMEQGRPISQKREKSHGFGIQSIINIAERHEGIYLFEAKDQIFQAQVLLHL